jgi:hypothetical protein
MNKFIGKRAWFRFNSSTDDRFTGKGGIIDVQFSDGNYVFLIWDDNGCVAQCKWHDLLEVT